MEISIVNYWFNDSDRCKTKLKEVLDDELVVDWRITEYGNPGDERFRLWAVLRNDKKEEFTC